MLLFRECSDTRASIFWSFGVATQQTGSEVENKKRRAGK